MERDLARGPRDHQNLHQRTSGALACAARSLPFEPSLTAAPLSVRRAQSVVRTKRTTRAFRTLQQMAHAVRIVTRFVRTWQRKRRRKAALMIQVQPGAEVPSFPYSRTLGPRRPHA